MNTDFSDDAYSKLQSQVRLQCCIFFFTTPSIGMLLFLFLPHSKDIHIDWFSLCLSSLAWGAGITVLTQLLTDLCFLRPRIKKQPPGIIHQYPVCNVLKKAKNRLIWLSLCIGLLVMFTTFTFLSSSESISISAFFGNLFGGIVGTAIIGCWSALMIDGFISVFIGKTLIFKLKCSNPKWYPHKNSNRHGFPSDYSSPRSDWYNDVTNPASPVHKATYRHSDCP